jgi:tetratricopeptide (TPR) repeat protein/ribonuclease BN (tRNA processing enzyme)
MMNEPAKESMSDDQKRFTKLFWADRKEASLLKGKTSDTSSLYKKSLIFARNQKWEWAVDILEASKLGFVGQNENALEILLKCELATPESFKSLYWFVKAAVLKNSNDVGAAIDAYRKVIADSNSEFVGSAWNNLGVLLRAKGEPDEAIKAYRAAIDARGNDTTGYAWFNLGNALSERGNLDEAIRAYQKAIEDPMYPTPGWAWNNLAIAFGGKKAWDDVIIACRKAITDPLFDTPGLAWNNLGNALAEKGQPTAAVEAYRKALEDPVFSAFPLPILVNLGRAYREAKQPEEAKKIFERVLSIPDPVGHEHVKAQLALRMLNANLDAAALSPDDRAIAQEKSKEPQGNSIEDGLIAAIQAAGNTQYDKYIAQPDSNRDDTLSVLRGWSSAVTLLEGSKREWRGGGYFIKWHGHGLVIDPGFDFLRNFHDAHYHGREIHAVIVSHNHPDHNSDLKSIDDLRYELYKRRSEEKNINPYLLVWDQDSNDATKFIIEAPKHLYEPIVMAYGYPQPIDLSCKHQAKLLFRVIPFQVRHGSDVPHAMGFVVELLDLNGRPLLRIGYTGDTGYFDGLATHLHNCDILIAHISQPSIEELQNPLKLKDSHLGYRGTARLLQECKPKLALIGEFWAGYSDLRIPLVKGLRFHTGSTAILPAGLGMHIQLPRLEIECTQCHTPTPFGTLKVGPAKSSFGDLGYLCPNCVLQ